jgi:hypothetical protein
MGTDMLCKVEVGQGDWPVYVELQMQLNFTLDSRLVAVGMQRLIL